MASARKDDSSTSLEDLEEGWDAPDSDPSAPLSLDELDSGWGDDEEEESEPELPDERLDPVAYAAAKKAREERAEARQKRRRAKMEAKRAKQRARVVAQEKQKKSKKPRSKKPTRGESTRPRRDSETVAAADEGAPRSERRPREDESVDAVAKNSRAIPWRLVVIAIVIFLGAAALAGVLFR